MSSPTRRQALKTAAAAAAIAALPRTPFAAETTGKRFIVNDASRLNPTPVYRHWIVGTRPLQLSNALSTFAPGA